MTDSIITFTQEQLDEAREEGLGSIYRGNWCAPLPKTLFHKPKFMKEVGPYVLVYTTLWANIIGRSWKDPEGGPYLKRDYYDKGKLVCSLPQNVLKEKLYMGKSKLNNAIHALVKAGVIAIVGKVKVDRNWQYVYELGRWHDKRVGDEIRRLDYYKVDKYHVEE